MRTLFAVAVLTVLFSGGRTASAQFQLPALFYQVQEDWQVVIGTPDPDHIGPQITTFMSPTGDKSDCAVFNINYREYPSFSPGGMQIQTWSGGSLVNSADSGSSLLDTNSETIRWTQSLQVSSGNIVFAVVSGKSTTFGNFGTTFNNLNQLKHLSNLTSLDGYSSATSVARSGVSWQPQRVTSLTLLQVRYYDSNGKLLATDSTPKSVKLTN